MLQVQDNTVRIKPDVNILRPWFYSMVVVEIDSWDSVNHCFNVKKPTSSYLDLDSQTLMVDLTKKASIEAGKVGLAKLADTYTVDIVATANRSTQPVIRAGDVVSTNRNWRCLYKHVGTAWGFDSKGNYILRNTSTTASLYDAMAVAIDWPYIYVVEAEPIYSSRGAVRKLLFANTTQARVIKVLDEYGYGPGYQYDYRAIVRNSPLGRPKKLSWTVPRNQMYGIALDSNSNVSMVGQPWNGNSVWQYNSSGTPLWEYDTGGDVHGVAIDGNDNVIVVGERSFDEDAMSQPAWAYSTAYTVGDEVTLYRKAYVCIADHTSDAIDADPKINKPKEGTDWKSYWRYNYGTVRKFDSSGVLLWRYDTEQLCYCVCTDSDANIYVGKSGILYEDPLFKLDSAGALQWSYNTGNHVFGVSTDSGGNVIAVGIRATDEDGGTATARKLDKNGVKQWHYDTTDHLYAVSVDTGDNNSIYLAGGPASTITSPGLWKLDSNGVLQWSKIIGTVCYGVAAKNGIVIVCGNYKAMDWSL